MAFGPLGLIDFAAPPLSLAEKAIRLAESDLLVPSGVRAGEPLELTEEQVEFLWAWYELTDDGLRYCRRRGILEGPKGWSKSPLGVVDAHFALVGECVPMGLDEWTNPLSVRHPLPNIQIAGVSLEGADNLYGQYVDAVSDSAKSFHGLDVGTTRTTRNGGGEMQPVTASSASRTGNPVTHILREETWLWTPTNGGTALAYTLNQNARKMSARMLDLTNTPISGAASVAEMSVRSWREMPERRQRRTMVVQLKASIEVPDLDDDDVALAALRSVYGSHALESGGWVDLEELLDDRPPGETTEGDWRRLYLGDETGGGDVVLSGTVWAEQFRPDARLVQGDTIALGFDGGDGGDATALYAVRWPDWTLFKLGVWERPRNQFGRLDQSWTLPRSDVLETITWALDTFNVVRGLADPPYWQTDIDDIHGSYGEGFKRFAHHSDRNIGPACERFDSTIAQLGWAPDETAEMEGITDLERHAAAARRERCGPLRSKWWRPVRRHQGWPIDAFSAAVSAVHALASAVADGLVQEEEEDDFFVY